MITCRKLLIIKLLLISKIYLVFFSQEMQGRLVQTKVYCKTFYSVWKVTTRKTSNMAATRNVHSNLYVIDTTCFNGCFLIQVITGRLIFYKSLLLEYSNCYAVASLKQACWPNRGCILRCNADTKVPKVVVHSPRLVEGRGR